MASSITISPELLAIFRQKNENLELDAGALEIAAIAQPGLDPAPFLRQLDQWAAILESRLTRGAGGAEFLTKTNQLLFQELDFQGDQDDYYHPWNSCLDRVIERRRGLPITLTILYLEIARRLLRPVYGIGLPGHYLARYHDGLLSLYVDVFRGGQILSAEQCLEMASNLAARSPQGQRAVVLAHATKRQILLRLLANLQAAYLRRKDAKMAAKTAQFLALATQSGSEN